MEPLPPDHSHDPGTLGSWARRTGFKSGGQSTTSSAASVVKTQAKSVKTRTEAKLPESQNAGVRKESTAVNMPPMAKDSEQRLYSAPVKKLLPEEPEVGSVLNKQGKKTKGDRIPSDMETASENSEGDDIFASKQAQMKYEIRDTPGLVAFILYGFQHYLSMVGSIVLIPLLIVPLMGGSDKDVAKVISTTFFVCGLSTLLHLLFGSRLPLIQGPSFAYLAPALVIINSPDTSQGFKNVMKELQGAVIISSLVQLVLGYSGLMHVVLRFINPVVVAPTVAAVGLSFFGYGFPIVGSCIEIGIPGILFVILFALHLRAVSIFSHRIFQVYAVPLGVLITWAYAFLLTKIGAYNFKGCPLDAVTLQKNISQECQRHIYTMHHCRTDISHALRSAPWVTLPYPFQWGVPTFHWKTGVVMIMASIIASVDSIGSYHATSLLVATKAPTPGIVGRSIGLEGITSALAGLWGIGTGATTLTENVHTIAITKMGSRRPVLFGACVLIGLSFVGKVGGFIATVPQVIVAALLCVMWSMQAAWGLSNLRYTETGSSRNALIVGVSLFLSLSIPAYFQQYGISSLNTVTTPLWAQPYTVATHGPIRTSNQAVNFVLDNIFSMQMVIAFLVAFFLDNTVPGSRRERGVYVWSRYTAIQNEPEVIKDYSLPFGLRRVFSWVRWVGL